MGKSLTGTWSTNSSGAMHRSLVRSAKSSSAKSRPIIRTISKRQAGARTTSTNTSSNQTKPLNDSVEASQLEERQRISAAKRQYRENIARLPVTQKAVPVPEFFLDKTQGTEWAFAYKAPDKRIHDPLFDAHPPVNQEMSETLLASGTVMEIDEQFDPFDPVLASTWNLTNEVQDTSILQDPHNFSGLGSYDSGQHCDTKAWSYEKEIDLKELTDDSNQQDNESDGNALFARWGGVKPKSSYRSESYKGGNAPLFLRSSKPTPPTLDMQDRVGTRKWGSSPSYH